MEPKPINTVENQLELPFPAAAGATTKSTNVMKSMVKALAAYALVIGGPTACTSGLINFAFNPVKPCNDHFYENEPDYCDRVQDNYEASTPPAALAVLHAGWVAFETTAPVVVAAAGLLALRRKRKQAGPANG